MIAIYLTNSKIHTPSAATSATRMVMTREFQWMKTQKMVSHSSKLSLLRNRTANQVGAQSHPSLHLLSYHTGSDSLNAWLVATASAVAVYGAVYFAQPKRRYE